MSDQPPTSRPDALPPLPPPPGSAQPVPPPPQGTAQPPGYPAPYGSPYPASYGSGQPAPYGSPYPAQPGSAPAWAPPAPAPAPARPAGPPALGIVALVVSLVALVVPTVLAALAGWYIAVDVAERIVSRPSTASFDLSILSGVRDWVLVGEIAVYGGTALGIWAIVQGIVAIVRRRGMAPGIAAIAVAAVAPLIVGTALYIVLSIGVGVGATTAVTGFALS